MPMHYMLLPLLKSLNPRTFYTCSEGYGLVLRCRPGKCLLTRETSIRSVGRIPIQQMQKVMYQDADFYDFH